MTLRHTPKYWPVIWQYRDMGAYSELVTVLGLKKIGPGTSQKSLDRWTSLVLTSPTLLLHFNL